MPRSEGDHPCRGCPFYVDMPHLTIQSTGDPVACKAVLVGEGPGEEELEAGEPFVGQSGRLMRKVVEMHDWGLTWDDLYVTNASQCTEMARILKEGSTEERQANGHVIARCGKRLWAELGEISPAVPIVAVGTYAIRRLVGTLRGAMDLRGYWYPLNPKAGRAGSVLATYHPAMFLHASKSEEGWRAFGTWAADLERGFTGTKPWLEEPDLRTWGTPVEVVSDLGSEMHLPPGDWVLDYESTTLNPHAPEARTLCACFNQPGEDLVYGLPIGGTDSELSKAQEACLVKILQSPDVRWIAHNSIHERRWTKGRYGLDIEMACTMQIEHLADSDTWVGLEFLACKVGAPRYWEEIRKLAGKNYEKIAQVPMGTLLEYCAWDVRTEGELWRQRLGEDGKLTSAFGSIDKLYWGLVHPEIDLVLELERHGFLVNEKMARKQEKELVGEMETIREVAQVQVGPKFNPGSTMQVAGYLFGEDKDAGQLGLPWTKQTPKGNPSTDEDVLSEIEHPVAALVLRYRKVQKAISTWLKKDCKLMRAVSPDGRIRPEILLHGTVSGRWAVPGLHQIPVRSEMGRRIRSIFCERPGWKIMDFDFSQIELRVLALQAEDEAMLKLFADGRDIHAEVSAEIFEVAADVVDDDQRRVGKDTNFGIAYGETAWGLSQKLGVPLEEAQYYLDTFYGMFPTVPELKKRTLRQAVKQGWVVSPFGRARMAQALGVLAKLRDDAYRAAKKMRMDPWKYPPYRMWKRSVGDVERSTFNSTIQGPAMDVMALACVRALRTIRKRPDWEECYVPILVLHDGFIWGYREDCEGELIETVKPIMESPDNPFKYSFPAEVKVGPSWGQLKELETF